MKNMKMVLGLVLAVTMIFSLVACSDSTHTASNKKNEESVRSVLEGREFPVLKDALDWDNVHDRAEFMNQKGRIGYLYIFSSTGVLLAEEPVLNKLTSLNTYITPMEQLVQYVSGGSRYIVEAPDLDGTYGTNGDGVFWFDPDGNYMEIPMIGGAIIIYSAERKQYDTPPVLQNFLESGTLVN